MNYNPILDRNYLLDLIKYADYQSIIKLCTLNKQLDFICRNDIQIRNIINRKRISDKTDRFLQRNPAEQFPLILAVQNDDVEIVDELINRGYDPSADYNSAIRYASSNGHLPVVDRLLQDERVDPSVDTNVAISLASESGNLLVVERLLQDERVDPSNYNNFAIRLASLIRHLPVVERLLQDYRVWNSLSNQEKDKYFKQIGKRVYSPLAPNTVPLPPSVVQTSYSLPPPAPTGPPFTTQFPTNIPIPRRRI